MLDSGRDDQFIRVIARPPRAGMTPVELVRGFLEASAGGLEGLTIAREYLTTSRAIAWAPDVGVQVYDDSGLSFDDKLPQVVDVSGGLAGQIDNRGDFSLAAPTQVLHGAYSLIKVAGEWRIDGCPDGLILSSGDVERGFRTLPTYFFDPTFATLVPNPITVPVVGAGLATTIVRSLLAGPTAWLAPSVKTAFPEGTALAIDSVPVESGIAQIELTSQVLNADDKTRQALSAQLIWSMRSLPEISGVRITVGGQPFAVSGVGPVQPTSAWSTYSDDANNASNSPLYASIRGAVSRLDVGLAGQASAPRTPSVAVAGAAGKVGSGWSNPAVSADSRVVAVLDRNATTLWSGKVGLGQVLTRRVSGVQLSAPSWDRFGGLWTVDRGRGIRLARTSGPVRDVPLVSINPRQGLGTLSAANVIAVAVSSDGMRAALRVQRDGHTLLLVARVERRGDDVRLADPRRVESTLADVLDAAWTSTTELAVLGTFGAAAPSLSLVDFGPSSRRIASPPPGAVSIAASPGRPLVIAAASAGAAGQVGEGQLWAQVAGSWVLRSPGSDPSY